MTHRTHSRSLAANILLNRQAFVRCAKCLLLKR